MEKTPGYFHTPGVAEKLWATNNRTRLVLIVRNPVNRLVSDYNQFRARNLDRGNDYPPIEHFLFTKNGNINISYLPLQRSIYHYHLVRSVYIYNSHPLCPPLSNYFKVDAIFSPGADPHC